MRNNVLRSLALLAIGGLGALAGYGVVQMTDETAPIADETAADMTAENTATTDESPTETQDLSQLGATLPGEDEASAVDVAAADSSSTEATAADGQASAEGDTSSPEEGETPTNSFTKNPVRLAKRDDGTYYSANPVRLAKRDDGRYYTEASPTKVFDPCTKADGTPYVGPGTAVNAFAPVNPCLPQATQVAFAGQPTPVVPPTATAIDISYLDPSFGGPLIPGGFGPEPPAGDPGSDYSAL